MLKGLKASLTLGREDIPWVNGLVGLNIEVERFPLGEGVLLFMEYEFH